MTSNPSGRNRFNNDDNFSEPLDDLTDIPLEADVMKLIWNDKETGEIIEDAVVIEALNKIISRMVRKNPGYNKIIKTARYEDTPAGLTIVMEYYLVKPEDMNVANQKKLLKKAKIGSAILVVMVEEKE